MQWIIGPRFPAKISRPFWPVSNLHRLRPVVNNYPLIRAPRLPLHPAPQKAERKGTVSGRGDGGDLIFMPRQYVIEVAELETPERGIRIEIYDHDAPLPNKRSQPLKVAGKIIVDVTALRLRVAFVIPGLTAVAVAQAVVSQEIDRIGAEGHGQIQRGVATVVAVVQAGAERVCQSVHAAIANIGNAG